MRQVGILCAAALVAVQETVGKLEDDHKKAKILAGTSFAFVLKLYATLFGLSLLLFFNTEFHFTNLWGIFLFKYHF